MRKWTAAALIAALFLALPALADPIRVLVVTGDHPFHYETFIEIWPGHDDIVFDHIDLKDHGEIFDDTSTWDYDVMAMYNMSNPMSDDPMTAQVRYENFQGLLDRGVGLVLMHHALLAYTAMPNREAVFGNVVGAEGPYGFHMGQEYTVQILEPGHPIVAGIEPFQVLDETYTNYYGPDREDNLVILGANHDPADAEVAWVRTHGNARIVCNQLGHDQHVFTHPAFKEITARSIRWAAGQLPLKAGGEALENTTLFREHNEGYAWRAAKAYERGHTRTPLTMLSRMVAEAEGNPAKRGAVVEKLMGLIGGGATGDASRFAFRQLVLLRAPEAVEPLAGLLGGEWAPEAAMVLSATPAPAAAEALVAALGDTTGMAQSAVIQALGEKRHAPAVNALAPLAASDDPATAAAAVDALGQIATQDALAALDALEDGAAEPRAVALAVLKGADRLARSGKVEAALPYFETYFEESSDALVRAPALACLARHGRDLDVVLRALQEEEGAAAEAAIAALDYMEGIGAAGAIAGSLDALPETKKVAVLAHLAWRNDPAVREVVAAQLEDSSMAVRMAALGALGQLGGAELAPKLLGHAAAAEEGEAEAAEAALARMGGDAVDDLLMEGLHTGPLPKRVRCAELLGARNTARAFPELLTVAIGGEAALSEAAFGALAEVTLLRDAGALAGAVLKLDGDSLSWAGEALASLCSRYSDHETLTSAVLVHADEASPAQAAVLLRTLGEAPTAAGLEYLSARAAEGEASVRLTAIEVLSDWPEGQALAPLAAIIEASGGEVFDAAVKGYIRTAGRPSSGTPQEQAEMLAKALEWSNTAEQRNLALDYLGGISQMTSLRAVLPHAEDEATQDAAMDALLQLASALSLDHPEEVKEAIDAAAASADEKTRQEIAELREDIVAFTERLLTQWNFNESVEGWVEANQVKLSAKDGILHVESTGDDPFLAVVCDTPGGELVFKMRARLTTQGPGELFWISDVNPGYLAKPDMRRIIEYGDSKGAWREFEIPFSVEGKLTALRIDPGMSEGTAEIDWIRIFRAKDNEE